MKFSTFAASLGAALSVSAAPTTLSGPSSTAASLATRDGTFVYVGHTNIKEGAKIVWQTGDDNCKRTPDYKTLSAGKGTNPCGLGFEYNGQKMVLQGCGISDPELWTVDGNGAPQNKISTCSYVNKDHSCSIWEWPITTEWECQYPH